MSTGTTSTSAPVEAIDSNVNLGVDEDEAALYDRQIRLWGLEAQNRMRKAHVLVYHMGGVSTEVIKNIVLSGIGTLTIVDEGLVTERDLAAGFFYRQEEFGTHRVQAALPRIQALNPLVKVRAVTDPSVLLDEEALKAENLDAIVSTKGTKAQLIALNNLCRNLSLKFYASSAQGLGGWIFSDLGARHEYMYETSSTTTVEGPTGSTSQLVKRKVKKSQDFVPLKIALNQSWKGEKSRKLKRLRLSPGFFATLALWECNARGDFNPSKPGEDPSAKPLLMRMEPESAETAPDASAAESEETERINQQALILKEVTLRIMEEKSVPKEVVFQGQNEDADLFFQDFVRATILSGPEAGDFSPTCAIIGGVLAQDLLNALGGREEPLVNWFQLDGLAGGGPCHQLSVNDPVEIMA